MTAGALARRDHQVEAGIGEERSRPDLLHVIAAQPDVEELMIVEFAQPIDHAAILPGANEFDARVADTVEKARGRTARCEGIDFQSTVDHAHGISPFRLGDPSSFDGVSLDARDRSPPAGTGGGSKAQVSRRAACREVGAKRQILPNDGPSGRINRSTIAFSQNPIDQSNECF
jgi:hypothetical protein